MSMSLSAQAPTWKTSLRTISTDRPSESPPSVVLGPTNPLGRRPTNSLWTNHWNYLFLCCQWRTSWRVRSSLSFLALEASISGTRAGITNTSRGTPSAKSSSTGWSDWWPCSAVCVSAAHSCASGSAASPRRTPASSMSCRRRRTNRRESITRISNRRVDKVITIYIRIRIGISRCRCRISRTVRPI